LNYLFSQNAGAKSGAVATAGSSVSGALAGVRVVEIGAGIASPLAAAVLGDFGAEVVKIERPGGDPARMRPEFAILNRNKSALCVAEDDPGATGLLNDLVAGADVLVAGGRDDPLGGWGLEGAAISASNPGLVTLLLPPYAGPAPWAGQVESDALLAAISGVAWRQASFGGVPVDLVYPHCLYAQGLWGATAAVAALVERERSGLGQTVTVSGLHGVLIAAMSGMILDPSVPEPSSAVGPGGPNPTYTPYRCADGRWLLLAALTAKFQLRALSVLGLDDLPSDPRLGGDLRKMVLPANRNWVRARIAAAFATKPRDHWVGVLEAADCPVGPVLERDEWLDHDQIRALGLRIEIEDPDRGLVVMPGIPLTLTSTPGAVRRPAPAIADSPAAFEWPARPRPTGDGAHRAGPLDGYRVLDLGAFLAGPYAGSLLAELGADVIKIEPPMGDGFPRDMGFHYNRGQRSLAVDLQSEGGKAMFERLAKASDIVVDNFRPGVLERLGIQHEMLARINPGIITASLTGFGEVGPLREKPGFDPLLMAMSGMMAAQGGDDEPVFLTHAANDVGAAVTAVLGVCLALYHRQRGGSGQHVASSLAAVSLFLQSGELVRYPGRPPARRGGRDYPGPGPLDRYYGTADGWVRLRADGVEALAAAGAPADGPPDALAERVAGWLRTLHTADAVERFARVGVAAVAARKQSDMAKDTKLVESGYLQSLPREDGGVYYLPGRLAFFSRTQREETLAGPGIGEHSRSVLAEAGVPTAEIDQLIAGGVVVEGAPYRIKLRPNYR
jgi:crotonobetainyl-CoA:carnitine CoA-transferase CaiB-like acyl-CoA transferase